MLLLSLGIGLQTGSAYADNTTGASSNQGVASSISNKWVKISTSGNVSMSIVPIAGDGALAAAKGSVNVKTNSGSGYQLYVSGSLYDTSTTDHWAALYKNGNTASATISTTTATSTATALSVNQWGYAVPSVSGNGYASASLYENVASGENITSTSTMNQLTWKGMKGDYQHVLTSTNTSDTMATTGEDTDIYYGTRVNTSTDNGNYTNTLIYTAFIDGGTSVTMDPIVLPVTDQNATTTVTFETGHESSSQPVTPSQISVELFDSANANATVATCNPATIVIVSGHDGTSGQPLQFTCTVTRNLATSDNNGTLYDVIVRVDKENNGLYMTYEHQDYWRFITTWNYSLSFNNNGATGGSLTNQTGTKLETESYTYTLPANPTKTNYTFNNWSDGTSTYVAGNTVTLTKSNPSKTLTASWNEIPVTYTLSYSAGDHAFSNASSFTNQTATQNMSAGTSKTFTISSTTPTTSDDYTFDHWTDGTNNYAPGATITLQSTSPTATLTAVWVANTWTATVNYNVNGGSGSFDPITIAGIAKTTTSQSMTLSTTKPTRSGMSFMGWATSSSASTAEYQPGATITVSQSNPTVTLYAVWKTTVAMANNANMQDMTAESCQNASTGTTYTLKDSRTSYTYYVGKLNDGNCWMLQNLYFASSITLTSSDSDVTSNYTLPSSSTSGWSDNSVQYFYKGSHSNATADSSYSGSNTGSYFSFLTATANTGTGSSGNASSSVCPKGWRLPTGGSSGEFRALYTAYSSTYSTMKSAFKAAYTSRCNSSACPYSDNEAYWWSSTIYSSTNGYYMYMNSSSFYPQDNGYKYYGRSVRCVLAS